MDRKLGYSEFVLLIADADKPKFDLTLNRFESIAEAICQYEIKTESNKYWVIQLAVLLPNKKAEDLCYFIYNYFSFIVMRQKDSQYILISDEKEFQVMLGEIYTAETAISFLYEVLTVEERYRAALEADKSLDPQLDNRVMFFRNGATYSLSFNKDCLCLFSQKPQIAILEETTNRYKEIDITEGLNIFNFHVAILNQKLEKNE